MIMYVYFLYYAIVWMQGDSAVIDKQMRSYRDREMFIRHYNYALKESRKDSVITRTKRIIEVRIDSIPFKNESSTP